MYGTSPNILYFFVYKTEFFPSQNYPNNLDPSYRSLGLFRKGKTQFIAKFHRTDLVICSHSREGKTLSHSQINYDTGRISRFWVRSELACC